MSTNTTEGAGPAGLAPLANLRILDLSTYVAGPSGTMTLAQLGAEVIRVDPIGGAADTSRLPLGPDGTSLYWVGLNKAKRSVEIDTRTPEGQQLVGALLGASGREGGIVLTNTPGVAWLSYQALRAYREDLIAVYIGGRHDGTPAVDYTVNCEVGLPMMTGPATLDRPVNHVLPAWDLLTGLHAALAILAAERVRRQTGTGQAVSLCLADVAVATMAHLGFIADVAVNDQGRPRDGNYLYGSFGCDFPTSDDQTVMVVALTGRHWNKLVELTGIRDAVEALENSLAVDFDLEQDRYRYRAVLQALLAPWFAARSFPDLTTQLDEARVLWGPYRTIENLVTDPTSILHQTDLMANVHQDGVGTFAVPRPVLNFSGWERPQPAPAPGLGQDTDDVLSSLLGLTDRELSGLRARGVIGGPVG